MKKYFVIIAMMVAGLAVASCADKLALNRVNFNDLPNWTNDDHRQALKSFVRSCNKIQSLPKGMSIPPGFVGTYGDWNLVCEEAKFVNSNYPQKARMFFERNFIPFIATNRGKQEGLFTGYFEIGLNGSKKRYGPYQYPVYKAPSQVKKGKQFYSREKIESGVLENKGLELLWVDDPVRLFFLHVQGSGLVQLDDGSVARVGYDGKNGHKYVSLGRYMIDEGMIKEEELSADKIKQILYQDMDKAHKIMQVNPSYVFFREITDQEGPIGGQGVPLTPERSLAVDKKFVPYGTPVWLDVMLNKTPNYPEQSYNRLVIAQDTGGAIKGPVRGDIFFGAGERAEEIASYKNNLGRYFLLLPKKIIDEG